MLNTSQFTLLALLPPLAQFLGDVFHRRQVVRVVVVRPVGPLDRAVVALDAVAHDGLLRLLHGVDAEHRQRRAGRLTLAGASPLCDGLAVGPARATPVAALLADPVTQGAVRSYADLDLTVDVVVLEVAHGDLLRRRLRRARALRRRDWALAYRPTPASSPALSCSRSADSETVGKIALQSQHTWRKRGRPSDVCLRRLRSVSLTVCRPKHSRSHAGGSGWSWKCTCLAHCS